MGAFVSPMPEASFWNDIIVGGAIGTIAGYNAIRADDRGVNTGAASLVALLGLWMVVAPFVSETTAAASFWSDILTGALVAVLAGYNAYRSRATARRPRRPRRSSFESVVFTCCEQRTPSATE